MVDFVIAPAQARPVARFFSFPNPVNEVSARLVAGGVVLLAAAAIVSGQGWLVAGIAYGFVARVLAGPRLSPLGQLVTRVITPRLNTPPRWVPGPPKRFAQAIGAVLTVAAAVLALGFGADTAADVLLALVIVAATLESVFAFCVGCKIFALLMRAGVIPAEVCENCNDIWSGAGAQPPADYVRGRSVSWPWLPRGAVALACDRGAATQARRRVNCVRTGWSVS
jgi:hypothetical protein